MINAFPAEPARMSVLSDVSTRETLSAERILSKKRIIADISLVALLLVISLVALLVINANKGGGAYARVTLNGEEVGKYPLSENGEYVIGDGSNTFVIEDGYAYMKYADCPNHNCINQGKISLEGERIDCLPNRVMIEILSE